MPFILVLAYWIGPRVIVGIGNMQRHTPSGAFNFTKTEFAKLGGDIWRRRYVAAVAASLDTFTYTRIGKGKFLWWACALGVLCGWATFATVSHHVVQPLTSLRYAGSVLLGVFGCLGCSVIWMLNNTTLRLHAHISNRTVVISEHICGMTRRRIHECAMDSASLLIGEALIARPGMALSQWLVAVVIDGSVVFVIGVEESLAEAERMASDAHLLEWCSDVECNTEQYVATVGALYL